MRPEARDHERAGGRGRCDREVDAGGEHDEGLTRRHQPEDGREQERRRHLRQRQERLSLLRAVDYVGRDEDRDEDERENERGVVPEQLADRGARPLRSRRRRHPPFAFWRIASPPSITTSTISVPWITCA